MNVRFLYFSDCPNARPAHDLLKDVLREAAPGAEIECIEIESDEQAVRYGFLGSPSIQIDGLDIEKERRNDPPYFGCRLYRAEQGFAGIPPREMVLAALHEVGRGK